MVYKSMNDSYRVPRLKDANTSLRKHAHNMNATAGTAAEKAHGKK